MCQDYTPRMKKSVKATLLSALLFPGIGHLVLRSYGRGVVLVLVAGSALAVVVTVTMQKALAIVERINRGEIAADMSSISAHLAADSEGSRLASTALSVLLICWLIGIADAWRLGRAADKAQSDHAQP